MGWCSSGYVLHLIHPSLLVKLCSFINSLTHSLISYTCFSPCQGHWVLLKRIPRIIAGWTGCQSIAGRWLGFMLQTNCFTFCCDNKLHTWAANLLILWDHWHTRSALCKGCYSTTEGKGKTAIQRCERCDWNQLHVFSILLHLTHAGMKDSTKHNKFHLMSQNIYSYTG